MSVVAGLDHIQLPIPFRAASAAREFYQDLLGLHEVRDAWLDRPGTLRFAVGAFRIDLCEGIYQAAASQAHLALVVHGLSVLARRLVDLGYTVDTGRLFEGHLYVDDPFGNRLELVDPDLRPKQKTHGNAARYLVAV